MWTLQNEWFRAYEAKYGKIEIGLNEVAKQSNEADKA